MSFTTALHPVADAVLERRAKVRYAVELRVRYRTLCKKHMFAGVGYTKNMSSHGVFIASRCDVPMGTHMEVSIDWPALLDGAVQLQLVSVGKVVRCEESGFAVTLGKCEYRTMKSWSKAAAPPNCWHEAEPTKTQPPTSC
ncbi:MAG: PilZ domain-containing protein [Bryobacteraceae bacterium]